MRLLEGRVRHCVIRIIQFKEHNDHALILKGRRLPFRMENGPLQICAPSIGVGNILCPGTRVTDRAPDTSKDILSITIEFSLHLLSSAGSLQLVDLKPPSSVGPRVIPFWSTESQPRIPHTGCAPARIGEVPWLTYAILRQRNARVVLRNSNFGRSS